MDMPLGGPLGDALATAEPASLQQLQQLAAPGVDGASKAAALRAEVAQAASDGASDASSAATAANGAEAAAMNAASDIGGSFSDTTPVGTPAVPCGCGDCIAAASRAAA
ncbi:MAG: hypothetical protein JF586_23485 [Burkholderiales bacterium]|nr:hypothetical protein [Burkholderiales bacterium]